MRGAPPSFSPILSGTRNWNRSRASGAGFCFRAVDNQPVEATAAELGEPGTTPVELLWDLVFVFAVTQVTTLLRRELTWTGFARAMLVLALVWWAWSAFVWVTNALPAGSTRLRATLLAATAVIFITGLALPHAFGGDAVVFAVSYALVRALHLLLYWDGARAGHASARSIGGFAVTVAIGMILLVVGAFFSDGIRLALWLGAAAIDYAGPGWLSRGRLRELQTVAVAHFSERYGSFIIICLGESIVAIGIGAGSSHLGAQRVGAVVLALATTIALWWTYFDRIAELAREKLLRNREPVLAAADAYSYIHLLLVAGIIVFAVGARDAVAGIAAPLPFAPRLALCGGVALYLAGSIGFTWRIAGERALARAVAAVACIVVLALTGAGAPAWASAGAVAAVLALLVIWEALPPLGARRSAG
jgi:low temperature requirement protein LtrA